MKLKPFRAQRGQIVSILPSISLGNQSLFARSGEQREGPRGVRLREAPRGRLILIGRLIVFGVRGHLADA